MSIEHIATEFYINFIHINFIIFIILFYYFINFIISVVHGYGCLGKREGVVIRCQLNTYSHIFADKIN